jgi:hypothetical protein
VALEYGFAEYTVADWLKIRAGKLFTPFGIYNEIHTAKPATLTVKEPFSTNRTDKWGTATRLYPRWLVGVGLYGNGSCPAGDWDYALAVSNGEQFKYEKEFDINGNPYEEDDNVAKAITARVRLATVANIEVGVSGYLDTAQVFDPTADGGDGANFAGNMLQTAFGASLKWSLPAPAVGVELEFVTGDFKPTQRLKNAVAAIYPADPLDTASTRGWSAMAYWRATESLTPYVRYERLALDIDRVDDTTALILGGVNYQVGGGLVLKLEGDYTMAQRNTPIGDGAYLAYFEVKAAAVVGF